MPFRSIPGLVTRVIMNVMANALDYSPPGEFVDVQVNPADAHVRVTITDRGPGIPEHVQDRIFEKFAQAEDGQARSQASSGLGLAFCRLAIEAHGGKIGVESEVGSGATFWFELPRDEDRASEDLSSSRHSQ